MTAPTSPRPAGSWYGTVTAVGPPVQVVLDGDTAPAPAAYNAAYTPAAADRVAVMQVGAQLFIIGRAVQ